jgi:hypothetical protein
LQHPNELTARHIMRRISDTEVRMLSQLLMQMPPGALLQDNMDALPEVFQTHWPASSAGRFALA